LTAWLSVSMIAARVALEAPRPIATLASQARHQIAERRKVRERLRARRAGLFWLVASKPRPLSSIVGTIVVPTRSMMTLTEVAVDARCAPHPSSAAGG